MLIHVDIIAHEYMIREINSDDSWDIGETGLEVEGVRLTTSDKYGIEVEGSSGDTVVVLVEHYSDGCTFGSQEYAEVKGIFKTEKEAYAHAGTLNIDHGYFGNHIRFCLFDATLP